MFKVYGIKHSPYTLYLYTYIPLSSLRAKNVPYRQGINLLAIFKGTDPQVGDEVIVLGAHLNHRGARYGQVYNGAVDNANGAPFVMEVVRVMMANKIKPKHTILFACWRGEERGLLGSRYYAEPPLFQFKKR